MPQVLTKPPPPAPTRLVVPPPRALKPWDQVLRETGYPTDVLVVDFEAYFDDSYKMGGGANALSTIEYIMDARWECLCCAFGKMRPDHPTPHTAAWVEMGQDRVEFALRNIDFDRITVLAQNLAFDAMILSRRFGIHPKFMVDLLGLARHQNARQKNDLGSLCKQYGLKEKGETAEFKEATFRADRFRKPRTGSKKQPEPILPMDPAKAAALKEYALNDVEREWELFTLLLPRLSSPTIELRLIQHHVELFTKPTLMVDFKRGESLIMRMQQQMDDAIQAALGQFDAI